MKNAYEIRGEVTAILLKSRKYGNKESLIDTTDFERAASFPGSWYFTFSKKTKSFYVQGNATTINGKNITISLHRWITNAPNGMVVDHIDHDTLNNKKSTNLRTVTNSQNLQNRSRLDRSNKPGTRNVYKVEGKNKWRVRIVINGKLKSFGAYDTFEEAKIKSHEKRMELGFLHGSKSEVIA